MSVDQFCAAFVFTLIGVALSLLFNAATRDPNSETSPIEWSWEFFWNDNKMRIIKSVLLGLLVIFVSLRFTKEIFGRELSMFFALMIGLSLDKVQTIVKNLTYHLKKKQ